MDLMVDRRARMRGIRTASELINLFTSPDNTRELQRMYVEKFNSDGT